MGVNQLHKQMLVLTQHDCKINVLLFAEMQATACSDGRSSFVMQANYKYCWSPTDSTSVLTDWMARLEHQQHEVWQPRARSSGSSTPATE
jgi:hypothetical protein